MTDITIGRAGPADSPELARLALQLGYPVEPSVIAKAISDMEGRTDEAVIVARDPDGKVVGWMSVSVVRHFYTPTVAEISGFVVDEAQRGKGIGSRMMDEVLAWAAGAGCPSIRLRANEIRIDAHRFYERLGFKRSKRQIVFTRNTSDSGASS